MSRPTRCPRCGRENDAGSAFCLDCGQPFGAERLSTTEALCASCGARIQSGFRFCGICGKVIASPGRSPPAAPGHGATVPSGTGAHGAIPAPPPAPHSRIRVALVRNDGMPGSVFSVEKDEAICGRTEGDILLSEDPTVSPRHARFTLAGGVLRVEDLGSVNGTFLRLQEPRRVSPGDEMRVGRQLLRLEPLPRPQAEEHGARPWGTKDPGYRFRLAQLLEEGGLGEIFPLREGENLVGREAGEVTFPSDRYVSARHARIEVAGGEVTLADAGSSNGTYVKLRGSADLTAGDQLLVGAQLLKVD